MRLSRVRWLLYALLALDAGQAAAQAQLKLPSSQGELRAFLRETGDTMCVRCGVVTSARAMTAADAGSRPSGTPVHGSSAVDDGTKAVPFGSERARYERDSLRQGPAQRHEVIVRYDDGSLGRIELARDPQLKRGDRVKVDGASVTKEKGPGSN